MKQNHKGFTLVELIIVVAILAALTGLLAPQYVRYVKKARHTAAISECQQVVGATAVFIADHGAAVTDNLMDQNKAEVLKLAGTTGSILDQQYAEFFLMNMKYRTQKEVTVRFDVTRDPSYWIDGEGVPPQLSLGDRLEEINQWDKDMTGRGDKVTQKLQKQYLEQYGGFTPLNETELELFKKLGSAQRENLTWKPVVGKGGEIFMIASDAGKDGNIDNEGNPRVDRQSAIIFYKGSYYFHTNGYNGRLDNCDVDDGFGGGLDLEESLGNAPTAGSKDEIPKKSTWFKYEG